MRALFLGISAVLLLSPASAQQKKVITENAFGDRVVFYPRPGTRLLRVSLESKESLSGDRLEQLIGDALAVIAAEARAQRSDVFAVTNMFCSSTQWKVGCAVEGAYLRLNEKIVVRPKDNRPVYFWTEAAIAKQIPSGWMYLLDLGDGLTGKVQVASGSIDAVVHGKPTDLPASGVPPQ